MEGRTEGESESSGRLVGVAETSKEQADFSGKLEHTGPAKQKSVASAPQSEQLAKTLESSLPKGKDTEPSV